MTVARPSVPAALPLLGELPRLLLLVLLCLPAVWGDCGLPPGVPNAQPALEGLTSFPEGTVVTYKCEESFMKIPGKKDSVICLKGSQWSDIEEFCNRSCEVPTRLNFASLKQPYVTQNYFPVGTVVEYECRPGYRRAPSLSTKLTCLEDLKWSTADKFCKKKSCPNPGEIPNGQISVPNGILFGETIFFSCNTGYKLLGPTSSLCLTSGSSVQWSEPFPECREIYCPAPPQIDNGIIQGERDNYGYRQSIMYACNKGFTMIGEHSIYCTVNDNEGEWSGPPPECRGKSPTSKVPPTVQKPTTVNVPTTEVSPTSQKTTTPNAQGTETLSVLQKHTTENVSATRTPPTPQKPTTVNVAATVVTPTPQKPTTINVPATGVSSTPQRHTTVNVSATGTLPTLQKPTRANDSATKAPAAAQTSFISKTLSTKTPPATQNPTMTNASATQATLTAQRFTTAKVAFTQSPPATCKSTNVHSPVTNGLKSTQRFPSAHITATRSTPVSRTTKHFRETTPNKGSGTTSGTTSLLSGHTCFTLTGLLGTIVTMGLLT
ncbi:complement decay-accelerating factor isoform X7 [Symphalangus syndactylus]|uniref:complement decay-accelerating factor isoform X7 n=1 Tax=Symphalangus syndactylus TaxID=9590 RepID=UPI0024414627|nr:complement decay-accelerating factor isoform X7 [Symphalangus syndactylus]XP_055090348.1 complement decay-accelerating factor isoform X7 [Symphalangus syndactylus]